MSTSKTRQRARGGKLRRITPDCSMPTGRVLRHFKAEDAQQLRELLASTAECVYDPSFRRTCSTAAVEQDADLFEESFDLLNPRTLSAAEERDLFLRYNYSRWRLMRLFEDHAGKALSASAARDALTWHRLSLRTRSLIVSANLGLIPTMIERSRITGVDFGELISEGQYALVRSADKFDAGRGFKFSTYACRAIITSITRAVALMARYRSRYPAEFDPKLQTGEYFETRLPGAEEDCILALRSVLEDNHGELTETEQRVLSERFGVAGPERAATPQNKTLREVAETFGVTRERIRQIQNRALAKLREVIDERVFAP